jgi:hypothetical protein
LQQALQYLLLKEDQGKGGICNCIAEPGSRRESVSSALGSSVFVVQKTGRRQSKSILAKPFSLSNFYFLPYRYKLYSGLYFFGFTTRAFEVKPCQERQATIKVARG